MTRILEVIKAEIPSFSAPDAAKPFSHFSLDSFDLVSLRASVEAQLGYQISDEQWTSLRSPADLIALSGNGADVQALDGFTRRHNRANEIGMPQMAASGLSESWLFKEAGDLQWQLISEGLQSPSSQIVDGNGDRLYATFTRVRMTHSTPLVEIRENSAFDLEGTLSRFGAGIFIGNFACRIGDDSITIDMISNFAKRASTGSNLELLKGQPTIPAGCTIPMLPEKPMIVSEYGEMRRTDFGSSIFECDYHINPYHDINGVGLLYFAAYPTIADTCELTYIGQGNSWARTASTVFRDVFYLANSDADEVLKYSVISCRREGGQFEIDALISRKNSGVPMAFIKTRKSLRG